MAKRFYFLSVLNLLLTLSLSVSGDVPATWQGPVGGSYNDLLNWDIGVVPLNGVDDYGVNIPNSSTLIFDVPEALHEVFQFSLGSSSVFTINPGRDLSVQDEAIIYGSIVSNSGIFRAESPASHFAGNTTTLAVNGGGTIAVNGTSYDSRGLQGACNTYTLFSANGAGSLLDLSTLQTINANFNDNHGSCVTHQRIEASNGGIIDLSSLQRIDGPVRGEDWLNIVIRNNGFIDLSALESTVGGNVLFDMDTAHYSLPLQTATDTTFNLVNGATLDLLSLTDYNGGTVNIPTSGTFNAPLLTSFAGTLHVGESGQANLGSLETFSGGSINIAPNGTVTAPNLREFLESSFTLGSGFTFTGGPFTVIDNSRLGVIDGQSLTIAAPAYDSTSLNGACNTYTLFSALGTNSVLDLSSLQSINAAFNDNHGSCVTTQKIIARVDGRVDLSGVQTIAGPARGEDWLRFVADSAGTIDLSQLQMTTGGNISFDLDLDSYTLPALLTANTTSFTISADGTLDLPVLASQSGGTYSVGANGIVNAPELLGYTGGTIYLDNGATFYAPKMTEFTSGLLSLDPNKILMTPGFTNIDSSQIGVVGGAQLNIDALSYDTTTLNSACATYTLLSANGTGSLLDLSPLQSINAAFNDNHGSCVTTQQITASASGQVHLSGVQTIAGPARGEDWLRFIIDSGGEINLNQLQETSGGNVSFDIDIPWYSLPMLLEARDTTFNVPSHGVVDLPELGIHDGGAYNIRSDGTVNAPKLTGFNGGTLSLDTGSIFNAPKMTDFTSSVLNLGIGQILITPPFTHINNSRFSVSGGVQFAAGETDYITTSLNSACANYDLLSATGTGSLLDFSSVQSLNAAFNDKNGSCVTTQRIIANGGYIDLGGLKTITGPARGEDRLEIHAGSPFALSATGSKILGASEPPSSSVIDLSSLESVSSTGALYFTVGAQGLIYFGDMAVTYGASFLLEDINSTMDFGGSLLLDSTSRLSAISGSRVNIAGDFSFTYTDEARLDTETAVVTLTGPGNVLQTFEIGGSDLGVPSAVNAVADNFGIGQLIIGQDDAPTYVQLMDVIDNGNRGGTGDRAEALYLYGLGGPDGLRIRGHSTLIIHNLNVYTWQAGQWVHINSLFESGQTEIPYDDGFISLISYEPTCGDFAFPTPPGDITQDCMVNSNDLHEILVRWLTDRCAEPNWCSGADITQDGNVDLADFSVVSNHWLSCTAPPPGCE